MLTLSYHPSPLGALILASTTSGEVAALDFEDNEARLHTYLARHNLAHISGQTPAPVAAALTAYFAGNLAALAQIPVQPSGTLFQLRVWQALQQIPPGQTRSYAQIAASLGQPSASRAIGMANGQNPISLIIPCHRVIGSSGALTGYAGGKARKAWLLRHEAADQQLPF